MDLRRSKDGGVRCVEATWPLGRGRSGPQALECFCWPMQGRIFSLTCRYFYIHLEKKTKFWTQDLASFESVLSCLHQKRLFKLSLELRGIFESLWRTKNGGLGRLVSQSPLAIFVSLSNLFKLLVCTCDLFIYYRTYIKFIILTIFKCIVQWH